MRKAFLGLVVGLVLAILISCGDTIQGSAQNIGDPTERGLMYVATAIVINAIFRAIFNK